MIGVWKNDKNVGLLVLLIYKPEVLILSAMVKNVLSFMNTHPVGCVQRDNFLAVPV